MANILGEAKVSEPVSSSTNAKAERGWLSIEDARKAVVNFLRGMPDVKEVKVIKLALVDSERRAWEAEAEVSVPNATIKALGLPLQKEVLDSEVYSLRLDNQLRIVAYELRGSVVE